MAYNVTTLSDAFTRESGRIVSDIQRRVSGKSFLLDHIEKGEFPNGMGSTLSVLTVERSYTADADDSAWTSVAPSANGDGGAACLPPVSTLVTGQTLRTFSLARTAVESNPLCLEDLRTSFDISTQLGITFDAMSKGVQWKLEMHAIQEYLNVSAYHVTAGNTVFDSSLATPSATWANPVATSGLTQGMLDQIYMQMFRDSFGDGAYGRSGAAYTYGLVCSPETSRNLIRENADIRQDFRYAFQGDKLESPLLQPYGVDRSYGNYVHLPYAQMPRYDIVGNVLTRRSYWDTTVPATKGFAPAVSALYKAAAYEVSMVWNPKVFKWLTPNKINSPGGNTSFNTPDYFPMTINWKNVENVDKSSAYYNPDKTIGFFRAVMAAASMPLHPEYGYCILHKRCPANIVATNCGAS